MASAVLLRAAVCVTGRFPALAGVDLAVDQGEVVVLEGPNGAGKTSVLRVCAGLLPLTGGEASVLGCALPAQRGALRRRVGLLGHSSALYDDLTVDENVRFAVRAGGGDPSGVDAALARFEVAPRTRRTAVGRLSAGQRRRVALAILAARRPELWLLDEPHAGLDRDARALLDATVVQAAAQGAAVVMASHEPEQSLPLADRVVSLAGGRVVGVRRLRRPVAMPAVADGCVDGDAGSARRVVPGGAHVA
jgi:heme ABC exporter ATP-binding subunit CcmA